MSGHQRMRRRGWTEWMRGCWEAKIAGLYCDIETHEGLPFVAVVTRWFADGPKCKSVRGANIVDLAQRASAAARRLAGRTRA